MSQYQNMNQFKQGPDKGDVAMIPNPHTLPCKVDPNSTSTLYPGSAVKLTSATGVEIMVDKSAATEAIFGFVKRTPKYNTFIAGMALEIVLPGSIMWMESQAAFNRGQLVEQYAAGDLVKAYAGVNTTVGVALDTASGANKLVRVLIRTVAEYSSSSSSSSCRSSSSSSSSSAAA